MDIQKLRKERNLSQQALAEMTGIPKGRINGWEQRGTIPKKQDYETLVKFFNEMPPLEHLVIRESASASGYNKEDTGSISKITNYKPTSDSLIPFWDIDFIAGTAFDTVDIKRSKPDYYMDIPDFRGCTAFRAYSDSMEGLIKSGSVLFGTKVENWNEHLEYGQIYGIVCQDGRKYLKYIKKYREDPRTYFLLESENKFYDEFEMPKEAIRSIWLIHGHLSKRI